MYADATKLRIQKGRFSRGPYNNVAISIARSFSINRFLRFFVSPFLSWRAIHFYNLGVTFLTMSTKPVCAFITTLISLYACGASSNPPPSNFTPDAARVSFNKIHKSLSVTRAMQAGLMKKPMTIEDIANLVQIESPKKRGNYNKNKITA